MIWERLSRVQQAAILRQWGKDPNHDRGTSDALWLGTVYAFWKGLGHL